VGKCHTAHTFADVDVTMETQFEALHSRTGCLTMHHPMPIEGRMCIGIMTNMPFWPLDCRIYVGWGIDLYAVLCQSTNKYMLVRLLLRHPDVYTPQIPFTIPPNLPKNAAHFERYVSDIFNKK